MSDNYAKVKARTYASDDDAENLLAGILDETEDVAKAEQERIEAELRAKEEEQRRLKEEQDRKRKEAAAAKLSAELDRLEKVEQRRTAKLEALKIEDLKDRGEWVDPEEERRKLEEKIRKEAELTAMKEAAESEARLKHQSDKNPAVVAQGAMPEASRSSNAGLMAALGIIVALLIGGGGVAFAMVTGYEIDGATYSKATFAPKDQQIAMVEKGSTPIPTEEPVVEEAEEEEKTTTRRKRQRPRRVASKSKPKKKAKPISGKPEQNKANKKADDLAKALETDIFGGGF